MKNIFLITAIFCFLSLAEATQFTLKGYVYDAETGYGIPNVQIFLSDSSKGIITDNSGFFIFKNLPKKK